MAALSVWTERSGYSFGTFEERSTLSLNFPVTSESGVTYTVISGKLPPGMRIDSNNARLIGTPYEVSRETVFEFCIRASKQGQIADRTFFITITGSDLPEFITPEGALAINSNLIQYFVLDSSYVDFQIEAYDRDTAAGQRLSFFIADEGGTLPPGLSLSKDGKIFGLVEPALSIKEEDGNGSYDNGYYDAVAFDFGFRPTNGYDSYIYDSVFFDFSVPSSRPKKLNRNYEFIVTMTDGDAISTRKFGIFVVGDDYFRADNIGILDGTSLFTADATYLRAPIWLTPSKLGLYRANNYITLILDTYDTNEVIYSLEEINTDISAVSLKKLTTDNTQNNYTLTITDTLVKPEVGQWLNFGGLFSIANPITGGLILPDYRKYQISNVEVLPSVNQYRLTLTQPLQLNIPNGITFYIGDLSVLPEGLTFDSLTGEVYGISPYQPAITKDYKFTVTATRFSEKTLNSDYIVTPSTIGNNATEIRISRLVYPDILSAIENITLLSIDNDTIEEYEFIFTDINDIILNLTTPKSINTSTIINIQYRTAQAEYARSPRVFTISIIGEVESVMSWISPSELGLISANYVSTLKVEATSSIEDAAVLYTKKSGRLPPGLMLTLEGEIVGKVNQYYRLGYPGLTRFYDQPPQFSPKTFTTFDNGETTVDRVYTFTVEAKDQLGYSATTKEFSITVDTPNEVVYGNLRTKPFLKLDQRASWKDFINNTSVFTPESIYRPNDPSFGIQSDLSMLIYAGIETTNAAAYIAAMGLNHKRKRFHFGTVKKATAVIPGTTTAVYEVVYIEMVDPLEINGNKLPNKIKNLGSRPSEIRADLSNDIWLSGFSLTYDENGNRTPTLIEQTKLNKLAQPGQNAIRPDPIITIDSTSYEISNPNTSTYYPNSVSNWRDRLKNWQQTDFTTGQVTASFKTERNYLPLWMRSIQPGTKTELDFQLVVPLCYCKVGTADDILLNIKFSGFDFKLIDYTADRYIIDQVQDEVGDKYLVFKNDRITV
jgi:hypothetical protein